MGTHRYLSKTAMFIESCSLRVHTVCFAVLMRHVPYVNASSV